MMGEEVVNKSPKLCHVIYGRSLLTHVRQNGKTELHIYVLLNVADILYAKMALFVLRLLCDKANTSFLLYF